MKCPKCGDKRVIVFDSRTREDNVVWRRRRCLKCDYTFSTRELSVTDLAKLKVHNHD